MITGASGLLGATALVELGAAYPTHGTYLRHPIAWKGTSCVKLDLTDRAAVESYLKTVRPRIVLHTAAAVNVDECELNRQEAYRANVEATETLARHLGETGGKLVYISTDAFFDGEGRLFTEDDEPTPMNYYGETKLLGEQTVRKHCPNHLIIRTNLYGWNYQDKLSLAEWMLSNFEKDQSMPLVYDVHYTPILTNTLVDCLRQLFEMDERGTFHIGGAKSISKLDFGCFLADAFGFSKKNIRPSSIKDISLKAKRSSNMAMSIEKIKKTLPNQRFGIELDLQRFKRLREEGYVERLKGRR